MVAQLVWGDDNYKQSGGPYLLSTPVVRRGLSRSLRARQSGGHPLAGPWISRLQHSRDRRPAPLAKAVSQGCIRMHNSDVEELADLVSVGTPVRFIYETIQVGLDPSTGQPHIIVYPDIYRLKTNTLSRALAKLSPFRLDGEIHEGALQALLARPTGKWTSIPIQVRVCWDGAPLDEVGYRLGEEIMVPLEPLMLKTGRKVHGLERRRAGGTWYGAATDVAGALGLGLELQEGTPDFYQVSLLVGDEALARETFIYRGELYVAVEELARRLGFPGLGSG